MRRDVSIFIMDWCDRAIEREVNKIVYFCHSFDASIFLMDSPGRTIEYDWTPIVGVTRNPSQGFDRSKSKTRGKVVYFSDREAWSIDFYNGLAWSSD